MLSEYAARDRLKARWLVPARVRHIRDLVSKEADLLPPKPLLQLED